MLSQTRRALEAFDNQHDFERLAADILNGLGYQDVEPMAPAGGADGGSDIRFTEAGTNGIAFVTLEKTIKDKFRRDLAKQQNGEGSIALFCHVDVSPANKLIFAKESAELGYTLQVFDLERLRSLLDGRFKDVRRRYLHIDDEIAERLRSEVKKLLRFPAAFADSRDNLCLLETFLTDQTPRRLFELLMRYDEQDVMEVPVLGPAMHAHMLAYNRLREDAASVEAELMQRLPALWNPPLPGALQIHARYSVLRFAGMSHAELSSGMNFLNFGITWERAENVYVQLAADKSLVSRFDQLIKLHVELSAAVNELACVSGPTQNRQLADQAPQAGPPVDKC